MSARDPSDYDVGYGKPPKANQFKPGMSGNPSGRRKGAKSLDGHLDALLKQKITIKDAGGQRQVSKMEALAMRLIEKAMSGDLKAMQVLLARATARTASGDEDLLNLSPAEQQILGEFLEAGAPDAD